MKCCKKSSERQRLLSKKKLQTNDFIYLGLWQTERQVDDVLVGMKGQKAKIEALTAQL